MKIYTCKDRLEDIMTCIYDAWADALLIGHDQIQLKKEPIFQTTYPQRYFFQSISVCILRIPFSRRRCTAGNL